jgi:uncharacterized protein YndB with AHSA1/START domain
MKKLLLSLGLLVALTVEVWAATPFEVVEITSINAPPAKVWEKLADFSILAWNPMVASVEIVEGAKVQPGTVRVVTLKDGTKFKEKLVTVDPAQLILTYEVIESNVPVKQQSETLQVTEKYGTAIVTWQGKFMSDNPQDARTAADSIQKLYKTGFAHLKTLLEAKK